MSSEQAFSRFSEQARAALQRARRLAGSEGARAVEVSHLRRSIDEAGTAPGPAVDAWTPDAKHVLELALRWSLQRDSQIIELADLRSAIFGSPASRSDAAPRSQRMLLPADLAEELIQDGCAVRPFVARGGAIAEPVSVAIEAINTGAALVSISLAVMTCRRLAAAALRRRGPGDPDELTITITVDGETKSLRLDRTAPNAEDEAFEFFAGALDVE